MIAWWNGLSLSQQIFAVFALPATLILLIQTILLLLGMGQQDGAAGDAGDGSADVSADHPEMSPDGGAMGPPGVGDVLHDDLPATLQTLDPDTHEALPGAQDYDALGHAVHRSGHFQESGLRLFTVRGLMAFLAVGGWTGIALEDTGMGAIGATLFAFLTGFAALVLVAWLMRSALRLQSSGNIDLANAAGLPADVYLAVPAAGQGDGKVMLMLQGRLTVQDAYTDGPARLPTGSRAVVVGHRGDRLLVRACNDRTAAPNP